MLICSILTLIKDKNEKEDGKIILKNEVFSYLVEIACDKGNECFYFWKLF